MSCDNAKTAFEAKIDEVQKALTAELGAIATDTESQAKKIADDFEADNDTAAGVGAAAGTAIGGYVGGPVGAVVGEKVGRTIGSLFTLEITSIRHSGSLDLPETTMKTKDMSYDLPTVVVRDTDIILNLPTVEMRRERGPDKPELTVRWVRHDGPFGTSYSLPESVVTWTPTYLDVPVTVMREKRIVIGVPTVEMRRQEMKIDVPEISMRRREFSFDVPSITIRFVQDAGKRTAAMAAALAQQAQDAAAQKQVAFKDRLRTEVAPSALAMFDCYRTELQASRSQVYSQFEPEIEHLTTAISAMASVAVPEDNADRVAAMAQLTDAIDRRDKALASFNEALKQLDESCKATLDQFLAPSDLAKDFVPAPKSRRTPRIPGLVAYELA